MTTIRVAIDARAAVAGSKELTQAGARSAKALRTVVTSVDKVNEAITSMTKRLTANTRAFSSAFPEAAVQRVKALADALYRVRDGYSEVKASATRAGEATRNFASGVATANTGVRGIATALSVLNRFLSTTAGTAYQAAVNLRKTGYALGGYNTALRSLSATAKSTRNALLVLFGGLSIASGIRKGVEEIAQFEYRMTQVRAATGETGERIQLVAKQVREFTASTRFSGEESAKGFLALTKAGLNTTESMKALSAVLDLSTNGNVELGSSAEYVAKTLRQFKLDAGQASRVVDVLVNTANRTTTEVLQISEALKFAGPVAARLGLDIETTTGILGVFANRGLEASIAGTNLRGILQALVKPTKAARDEFADMGLDIAKLNPATNDFIGILDELAKGQLNTERATKIFNTRIFKSAQDLVDNRAELKKLIDENRKFAGQASKNSSILDNTLVGAYKRATSAIKELVLQVGDKGLSGALRSALEFVTNVTLALAGMEDKMTSNSLAVNLVVNAVKQADFILYSFAAYTLTKFIVQARAAIVAAGGLTASLAAISPAVWVGGIIALAGAFLAVKGAIDDASDSALRMKQIANAVTTAQEKLALIRSDLTKAQESDDPALVAASYRDSISFYEDYINKLDEVIIAENDLLERRDRLDPGVSGYTTVNSRGIPSPTPLPTQAGTREQQAIITSQLADLEQKKRDLLTVISSLFDPRTGALEEISKGPIEAIRVLSAEIEKLKDSLASVEQETERNDGSLIPRKTEDEIQVIIKAREKMAELTDEIRFEADTLKYNEDVRKRLTKIRELDRVQIEAQIGLYPILRAGIYGLLTAIDEETAAQEKAKQAAEDHKDALNDFFKEATKIGDKLGQALAPDDLADITDEIQGIVAAARRSGASITLTAGLIQAIKYTDELNKARKDAQKDDKEAERLEESLAAKRATGIRQIEDIAQKYELEARAISLTNDEREREIAIAHAQDIATEHQIDNIDNYVKRITLALDQLRTSRRIANVAQAMADAFGDAFENIILQVDSVKGAIENLLKSITAAIVREAFIEPVKDYLRSFIQSLVSGFAIAGTASSSGGGSAGGLIGDDARYFTAGAKGYFTAGPQVRRMGPANVLHGESGKEAVVPLQRDSNGVLGVRTTGGSRPSINNVTIVTEDARSFAKSTRQIQRELRLALGN